MSHCSALKAPRAPGDGHSCQRGLGMDSCSGPGSLGAGGGLVGRKPRPESAAPWAVPASVPVILGVKESPESPRSAGPVQT